MADSKIKISIELEKGGATATLKNFEGQVIKSGVAVKELRKELGNFVVSSARMTNNVKLTKKELASLEKTVGGFHSSTGAATSAAMELGRVVSDAPYGIRGMANNVSQLASQMTFMATSTDLATGKTLGFRGAIKSLWSSLMGPLGILLAIQTVISALDYFSNQTEKAEKSVKSMDDSIGEEAASILAARDALESGNLSREESIELIGKMNKKYEDLNLELDDNNKLTSQSKENIDELAKSYINLAKAQALQGILTEKYSELLKLKSQQQELDLKANKAERESIEAISNSYRDQGTAVLESTALSARSAAEENRKATDEIQKDIDKLLLTAGDEGILDLMFKGKKGRKDKRPRVEALNVESASDFNERMRKIQKESLKLLMENGDYVKPSEILKILPEEGEVPEGVKEAMLEYHRAVTKEFLRITQLEEIDQWIGVFKTAYTGLNDFLGSEFDRQMTIEQNKTNALNEELNNRLLNEQLSADQRRSIQNQIWQNDEALRKKQEEIAKKKFRTEKAFNISMAIVDTYAGATRALNDKTVPSTIARFALAGATIASGLLQVASIARQQFQSSSAATPIRTGTGGAGGGAGDRSFNFTLAGQSEGNQLLDAIQSQFNNPIRAYVVSGDVTNQQQLDANIQSTASF